MKLLESRKKVLTAFALLMSVMLLCTLISKSVYAYQLPQITVQKASKRPVSRQIEALGYVSQGRVFAETTLPNLLVDSVEVGRGDSVEKGQPLFKVNEKNLKEQIAKQQLDIKKLELSIAALTQNQSLKDQKKVLETNRTLEDYLRTVSENDVQIQRARDKAADAKEDLQSHLEDKPEITSESKRREAEDSYKKWVKEGEEKRERVSSLEKQLRNAEAEVEKAQKAYDEAVNTTPPEAGGAAQDSDSAAPGGEAAPEGDAVSGNDIAAEPKPQPAAPDIDALKNKLDEAAAARDACKAELEGAQDELADHDARNKAEPDFDAEDAQEKAWENQAKTLERNVKAAGDGYEDAQQKKRDEMQEALRKTEDAAAPEDIQDTLAVSQLELAYLKEILEGYLALQKQEGVVSAARNGVVTRVNVSPGDKTPDTAAVIYADQEDNLEFLVPLTSEQKRYVNQGTEGSILLGDRKESCKVDYIEPKDDGSYEALIVLPDGFGRIGESGSLSVLWNSEVYRECIPLGALREENGRNYIYVVRRQQGILGEEQAAEKRYVQVKEKGDSFAALADGSVSEEEEVILTATKAFQDGTVVRYRLKETETAQ